MAFWVFFFRLFFKMLFYLRGILPACLSVSHLYPWCTQRPEECVGSAAGLQTVVCSESNLGLLEVLLTH